MRLLLVGFGVAALAVVGWIFGKGVQDSREWREILALAEKDLGQVSTDEEWRVSGILQKRFPRPEDPWGLPWGGLRLQGAGGEERVLLLHGGGSLWPPAVSMIPISVLDGYRRDRSLTWILPGDGGRIAALRGPVGGAPVPWCFEMRVTALQDGEEVQQRHYYALLAEKPVVIRLEDPWGLPLANDYRSVYSRIGEEVPERSAADWELALHASDLAEILRALLWLGGLHEPPTYGEPPGADEAEPSRQAFEAVLLRPGVRRRVVELRDHPQPWVAQAAAQVEIPD